MKKTVRIPVRWSDLDAYRHVNNAAIVQLMEEARIALFWHNGANGEEEPEASRAARDLATYVVHQEVEYVAPLAYPRGPLPITLWVSRLGVSSIEVCYEIPTLEGGVAARATTTVVMVDIETGRPRRLSDDERSALEAMRDEPLQLRRRG